VSEAPVIPAEFDQDSDPYTAEDGRGDDVDGSLPEIDPDDFPRGES
jgi:hypothetical protein